MTNKQITALRDLCERYGVAFDPSAYTPQFDLPDGWVAGWVGTSIYVGCSPEGNIHT